MIITITCFFLVAVVTTHGQKQKPNFILIMTDDQGFDDYGFRQPPLQTPNLDRLMTEGVQFTRFYTHSSCTPTRSSLLTGRNFMRTGTAAVGYGAEAPHPDEYLLGQALQDAGYVTGMVGKWNLGSSDAELPHRRGFNETWELWSEDNRGFGRYEHFKSPFARNGKYTGIEDGWQVERVTDKGIDFIETHKDDPFFLYLPYSQPHQPWLCPEALQKKYMKMGIGEHYAMFLGMMEQLDTQVGRILTALKDNELADNTIVFFLGDNGQEFKTDTLKQNQDGFFKTTGETYVMNDKEVAARNPTGFLRNKGTCFEGGLRNRLGIYCPSKFIPKQVSEVTVVMDIYPTILRLADHTRKSDVPSLDGRNLRRFFVRDNAKWRAERSFLTITPGPLESFLADDGWQYRFTKKSWPMNKRSSAFVDGDWVIVNDKGKFYLFDLAKDPLQKLNLLGTMPGKFQEMERKYNKALKKVRSDPHAWKTPVQLIGLPGVNRPYIEMEYTFRMRGENRAGWDNTNFLEIGAVQELKVHVLRTATYRISLHAYKVPPGTRVRLYVGKKLNLTKVFETGEETHELGDMKLKRGRRTIGLTLLECSNVEALRKMRLYNIRMTKIA